MKDKRAPYKGLTVKEYMKKAHPDISMMMCGDTMTLVGEFCGHAGGLMTDTGCINVCERFSSCDEACFIQDLVKLVEGGYGDTWCDVCGELIRETDSEDMVRVSARGKRYKCCGENCAGKVRA